MKVRNLSYSGFLKCPLFAESAQKIFKESNFFFNYGN